MTEEEATVQPKTAEKVRDDRRRSALVKSSSGLAPYGTPEELAEMVGRMRYMIPGGNEMKDEELWGLSQAAFVLKLNPFAKEICWLKDGPFPQIRGVRRLGREQLQEIFGERGRPQLDFVQLTDPIERKEHLIPDGALAFKCLGMVPAKRTAYVQDAKEFALALFGTGPRPQNGHEIVLDAVGAMPITVGYGYITKEEMHDKDNPRWFHICSDKELNTEKMWGKMRRVLRGHDPCPTCNYESRKGVNRYPHVQCAMKRSEAHFWYQECDLPFELGSGGEGLADFGLDDDGDSAGDHVSLDEAVEGQFRIVGNETPTYRGHPIIPEYLEDNEAFANWKAEIDEMEDPPPTTQAEEHMKSVDRKRQGLYGDGNQDPFAPKNERRPHGPAKLQTLFLASVEKHKGKRKDASLVQNATMLLDQVFDNDDDRNACQMFFTGKPSLDDWTGAELLAMHDRLQAKKGNGDKWHPNALSVKEMRAVVKEMREEG